jgi:uncharacterized protein
MSAAVPRDANEPAARLPRRRAGAATEARPAAEAQPRPGDLAVVKDALCDVTGQDSNIQGMLVASTDGLVLACDTTEVHIETVAAMAAAAASIAAQFTAQAEVGQPRASMFEGSAGHVGVFPVEPGILLVVLGKKDTTMGMFNIAAKNAVTRLQQTIARRRVLSSRIGTEDQAPQQN